MNIVIVGTGYVGLVTGACFADMGNKVSCVDINETKILKLRCGEIPIYEPGLEELVKKNVQNSRLIFTTSLESVIEDADVVFSAVGTPPNEDGSADLQYVLAVAKQFGELINKYTVFVTKSTVPVGTAKKVEDEIKAALKVRKAKVDFDVVSNPEFLKEGSAIKDFMSPDRVVVGTATEKARQIMEALYKPFTINNTDRIIFTDIPSAEMTKYAANAMLATRISFMNEIANLCDKVGANVDSVRKGIGADTRIGNKFLYAGCGYGGSCFPKDVKALISTGNENGEYMHLLNSVEYVNQQQKNILFKKLSKHIDVKDKKICIWGLSFKPETDDLREAPSLVLINSLIEHEAGNICVYDPIVKSLPYEKEVEHYSTPYACAEFADAIVLVTEWKEFRMIDWEKIKKMANKNLVIIDGRNLYDRKELEQYGFTYEGIGR